MIALTKTAAIASSAIAAVAAGVALMLPAHSGTPAAGHSGSPGIVTARGAHGRHTGIAAAASTTGIAPGGSSSGLGSGSATGASGGSGLVVQAGSGGSVAGRSGSGGSGSGSGGSGGTGAGGGSHSGGSGSGSGGSGGSGSGSGSGSGGTFHLPVELNPNLPHVLIPTVTAIPSPSGTIGDPGVPCLQGYVWRKAYAGDYVCVTPANRTQAAADNAAALSRVQPGGGAYGQYTCIQGYVWRQVVPDDYTCVTPATRSQAAYDNSQASNRVALLNLWVTDWNPPSQNTTNCSGDVCSTTEGGWDGPDFQVNGDYFNFGQVQLQIHSSNGLMLWWANVNAGSYPGYAGGAFGEQTPTGDCSAVPGTTDNDYVVAYDFGSGRWSNELPIDSDCASF